MYDIGALYEASSVSDAVRLLNEHPAAIVIAGGSDVLIKLREGKLAGCELVSIYKIDALRGVSLDADGTLRILPLTSFSHITRDPLIQKYVPVLGEATDKVGGPQVRNIGTIGGNISNGVTSADSASTLMAFDAVVEITGADGVRTLPITQFYTGPGKVALAHGELVTAILIPKESCENCFGHYIKYSMRNAMDIATIGCSVNVVLSADKKTIERARAAFGVAGPVPMRARTAEQAITGKSVSRETVELFADSVRSDVKPRTSWRATAEFRLHIIMETARRALAEAVSRAGGVL